MPTKLPRYKLGITADFEPIWDHFRKKIGGNPSEMIRRLIFSYVNDKKGFVSEKEWGTVKTALKTYRKFVEGNLDPSELYCNFYVIAWNDYYAPVHTREEVEEYCEKEGYEIDENVRSFPKDTYYSLRKIDDSPKISKSEDGKSTLTVHVRVSKTISKPGIYLVVRREKQDSLEVLEKTYNIFKRQKNQTVTDLIAINYEMVRFFQEYGLFDWPPALVGLPFSRETDSPSSDFLLEKYGSVVNSNWKDIPEEIEEFLILKPYHLQNKKNLRKLKREHRRITYTHSTVITFDSNKDNKILGKIDGVPGWQKMEDGANDGQVIEVED